MTMPDSTDTLQPLLSILIPTLLKGCPNQPDHSGRPSLWLDHAVGSICQQNVLLPEFSCLPASICPEISAALQLQIVVCIDAAASSETRNKLAHYSSTHPAISVEIIHGSMPGYAHTINAAAKSAKAPLIAFLDDDDAWHPQWLSVALPLMSRCDFLSSTQQRVLPDGTSAGVGDYPVPSTWIMKSNVWHTLGGFDPDFPIHPDTHFLGKLNAHRQVLDSRPFVRKHLLDPFSMNQRTSTTLEVSKHAKIHLSPHPTPLIRRTVNPGGMTARRHNDPNWAELSSNDHSRIRKLFGHLPC